MTTHHNKCGRLALIGGGEFDAQCAGINAELLSALATKRVLLVPAAAAFESPATVVAQAAEHFAALGATLQVLEVFNRRDANDDALVRAAKSATFIYICDGSAQHLRSVLKDTQLFDVLVAAHRNGAVLAASGAGATVLCDPMIDSRGGAYTVGFGVVENTALFAHHTANRDHIWERSVELLPADTTLIGVPVHTAVVREPNGELRVAGTGTVVTCRAGQSLVEHREGLLTLD